MMMEEQQQTPATVAQFIHERNTNPSREGEAVALRPEGSVYMGNFAAEPIETLRVAIIGLSERGIPQTLQFASIPHCRVVGLCDLQPSAAEAAAAFARVKAGLKFSVPAWYILLYFLTAALIPKSTPALPLVWALSVWQWAAERLTTCV